MRLSKLNIPTTLRVRTGCATRLTHTQCLRYRKSCLGQQIASFSSETGASAKEDSLLVQAKADNIVIGDLDATLDAHREQRRQRKQQKSAHRVVRYAPYSGQSNETRSEGNRELLESADFPLRLFPRYRLGVEPWLKDVRLSQGDGDARCVVVCALLRTSLTTVQTHSRASRFPAIRQTRRRGTRGLSKDYCRTRRSVTRPISSQRYRHDRLCPTWIRNAAFKSRPAHQKRRS